MLTAVEEVLAREPEQVNLFLNGVTVGEVGVIAISRHAKATRNLRVIELRGSTIGARGAEYLASGIQDHPTLSHLGLGRNGLGSKGAIVILKALQNVPIQTLDLETNLLQDSMCPALVELLKSSTTLVALNLERNDIRLEGATLIAQALKTNTVLRNLNLGFNRCSNAGTLIGDALKVNRTLLTLNLGNNGIYPEGAKTISDALAGNNVLCAINLQHNQAIDSFSLPDSAPFNSNLKEINFFGNRLQTALAPTFSSNLRTATGLIGLSLGRCSANGVAMIPVLSAIASLTKLTTLDIMGCGLSADTAQLVANTIISLPNLTTLVLDENRLDEAGGAIVTAAVNYCPALINLSLNGCCIGHEGATSLAQAIISRRGLPFEEVRLATNLIANEGIVAVMDALCFRQGATDCCLRVLDVHGNERISGRCCATFAKLMSLHKSMESVNIRGTILQSDCGGANYMTEELANYYAVEFASTTNSRPAYIIMNGPSSGSEDAGGQVDPIKSLTDRPRSPPRRSRITDQGKGTKSELMPTVSWTESLSTVSPAASSPAQSSRKLTQGRQEAAKAAAEQQAKKGGKQQGAVTGGNGKNSSSDAQSPQPPKDLIDEHFVAGFSAIEPPPLSATRHQLHHVHRNIEQLPITEDQLRHQFSLLDVRGDGVITRKEYERYLEGFHVLAVDSHSLNRAKDQARKHYKNDCLSYNAFSTLVLKLANL
jgi:Ran GTPase-activating protein (RanGAP) involved in mRNA processing and transport